MDESDQSLDLIRRNRDLLMQAEQTRRCCHEALATAREVRGMAETVHRRAVQVSVQSAAVRGLPNNIGTPVVSARYLQALRAETADIVACLRAVLAQLPPSERPD